MAGRPRKPTNLKIHEGNRGHRTLKPQKEPQPAPGIGETPGGLSDWGVKLWTSITAELDRLNLLTVVDHGALSSAIVGADQAHAADGTINGLLRKIRSGKAKQEDFYRLSIMNNVSKKGWNQFKAFATEFGLTPASRSRLTVAEALPPMASGKNSQHISDPVEAALCELPVQ
jgi:P27 family predicted phage terminase small subunit